MQTALARPVAKACPFGADLTLDDLLTMARVELAEARQRLVVSTEFLDLRRPLSETGLSREAADELIFTTAPWRR
jgi:hypothetical protein